MFYTIIVTTVLTVVVYFLVGFFYEKISDVLYDRRSQKREEEIKKGWLERDREVLERAQTALREKTFLIQIIVQYDELNQQEKAALCSAASKVSECLKTRKRLENE